MDDNQAVREPGHGLRFRDELADFWRFIRRPTFAPRTPARKAGPAWWVDWFTGVSVRRLFAWACFLWAVNMFVLGPLAVSAAGAAGATHRLNIHAIPWVYALVWAPIVEELVFRYGLRRPAVLWWFVPIAVAAMFSGPHGLGVALVGVLILACMVPFQLKTPRWRRPLGWHARLVYRHYFPWIFHLSSIAFAALHLYNFNLHQTPWLYLPFLVLPQWLTGMVLGWLRVRRGIGAAIMLHSLFNAGPLLFIWLVLSFAPDSV